MKKKYPDRNIECHFEKRKKSYFIDFIATVDGKTSTFRGLYDLRNSLLNPTLKLYYSKKELIDSTHFLSIIDTCVEKVKMTQENELHAPEIIDVARIFSTKYPEYWLQLESLYPPNHPNHDYYFYFDTQENTLYARYDNRKYTGPSLLVFQGTTFEPVDSKKAEAVYLKISLKRSVSENEYKEAMHRAAIEKTYKLRAEKEKEGLKKANRLLAEYDSQVLPLMKEAESLKNCSTAGVSVTYDRLVQKVDNNYYEDFDTVISAYVSEVEELKTNVVVAREIHNKFQQRRKDVLDRAQTALQKNTGDKSANYYKQLLVESMTTFEGMDILKNSEEELNKAIAMIDKRIAELQKVVETIDRNKKLVENAQKILERFSKTELADWMDKNGNNGESFAGNWGIDREIAGVIVKAKSDVTWGIKRTEENYGANDYRSEDLQTAVGLLENTLHSFEERLKEQKNIVTKYADTLSQHKEIADRTDKAVALANSYLDKDGNLTSAKGIPAITQALKAMQEEIPKIQAMNIKQLPLFQQMYTSGVNEGYRLLKDRAEWVIGKDVQKKLSDSLKNLIDENDPLLHSKDVTKLEEGKRTPLDVGKKMLLGRGISVERKDRGKFAIKFDTTIWNPATMTISRTSGMTLPSKTQLPVLEVDITGELALTMINPVSYSFEMNGVLEGTLKISPSHVSMDIPLGPYVVWKAVE